MIVYVWCAARRTQQLMTLWSEFQKAEKLHSERIKDMEARLQRVSSSVFNTKLRRSVM